MALARRAFFEREPDDEESGWEIWRRRFTQMGSLGAWLIIIVIIGIWLLSGMYTVGPSEVGLVKRFGKYVKMSEPGFHYRLPRPIESVVIVDRESVRTEEIGFESVRGLPSTQFPAKEEEALMLSGDGNIVHVEVVVQYRVKDPESLAFQIISADEIVDQAAKAVIREKIAQHTVDEILTTARDTIANTALESLQNLLDSYGAGISVLNVRLQEVTPPDPVAQAFDDVNSSIQDKERIIFDARKYENDIMPKAEGEAQQIINQAGGYRQSRVLLAQGDVARFKAVLDRYKLGEDVTRTRLYIETMEEILPQMNKIILTQGSQQSILSLLSLAKVLIGGDKK